jgi:hypothetical protein
MGSPQKTPFKKSAKHFVFLLKGLPRMLHCVEVRKLTI